MATINNEIDMFNHLLGCVRQQAVEVEPAAEFFKGLKALDGVLFHVEKRSLFGGSLIVFSHMLSEVAVKVEDIGSGNLRLSYEVLHDHEAKMKGF